MSEGICVPTQGAWSLVRGNPESHIPMYNRHPLAQREIGAISSQDRDERARNIVACNAHLRDLIREHSNYVEPPPRRRRRGRPMKAG